MLLVAKNIISDSNLFFYLYNFSQSTTFEYNSNSSYLSKVYKTHLEQIVVYLGIMNDFLLKELFEVVRSFRTTSNRLCLFSSGFCEDCFLRNLLHLVVVVNESHYRYLLGVPLLG